jgi:hypothetical protein
MRPGASCRWKLGSRLSLQMLYIRSLFFEPKKSERPLTDITAVVLNINKTANEREVFNEMIR